MMHSKLASCPATVRLASKGRSELESWLAFLTLVAQATSVTGILGSTLTRRWGAQSISSESEASIAGSTLAMRSAKLQVLAFFAFSAIAHFTSEWPALPIWQKLMSRVALAALIVTGGIVAIPAHFAGTSLSSAASEASTSEILRQHVTHIACSTLIICASHVLI